MTRTITFLPAFNDVQIRNYFFNDDEAIREIFKVTSDNLGLDLKKLLKAIEENNITELQHVLHSIKPVFNFIGLPALEEEVFTLYKLSMQARHIENIKTAYIQLWPKLVDAKKQIEAQHKLFEMQKEAVA
jgi:hypothetical protein